MGPRGILLLLALMPLALAQAGANGDTAQADPMDAGPTTLCAAPPCGWILPTLDFDVADKLPCGGGQLIYAEGPPNDCFDVLAPGETRVFPALFVLKWEISEEGTYPKEVGTDIVISFSGTGGNAPWLKMTVTGEGMVDGTYHLDDAALADPDNLRRITNEGGQETLWFWYERAVVITFTRTGDPDTADLRALDDREAVLAYFVKGLSSESGPRFKQGFGIEEFRFNACADPDIAAALDPCPGTANAPGVGRDQDVPGVGWFVPLGLCFMLARRR